MLGMKYNAEQAKRLILEAPDNTRHAFATLLTVISILVILCTLTWFTLGNQWECLMNNQDNQFCRELRYQTSCRNLTGPISAIVKIDYQSTIQPVVLVECPFKNASSELRTCFTFLSIISAIVGIIALNSDSKKKAEVHVNTAYFLSLMLAISSTFDLFAVWQSNEDNQHLCQMISNLQSGGATYEYRYVCNSFYFDSTIIVGYLAALGMLYSGIQMSKWISSLSVEGVQ